MNARPPFAASAAPHLSATFANAAAVVRAVRFAQRFLRPPPDLAPSVWAEQNVRIPVGNAVPGLIRFDNAPYQREPLDMMANAECSRITLMWGAQVGKTQTALCGQAFFIAQDPCSQIMMQPSQGDLHTWLETKFNPLVEENPTLQDVIAKPRGRDGVNNQRMKSYPGGFMMFSWSGSPKTMRGRSAPKIVCDETDGYDRTKEGHPVGLLWQRAATFGDQRLLVEISTPTIKGASWIEAAFLEGDQRRFQIACPHCGSHQVLNWAGVCWDKNPDGEHLPETAHYVCAENGCVISDGERIAAIRSAERQGAGWKPSRPFRGHASYHINELYSCFRRLQDIVQSFLDKKAANDLQTFTNVSLAETWVEEAEEIAADKLMKRATSYAAQVPADVGVLTAGVDMQEDRLEIEVVGWGLGETSWNIDYKVIWGDPTQGEIWSELFDYLGETFRHEHGADLRIVATCVDTGGSKGLTQSAYENLAGKHRSRIFAIKGKGGWDRPVVSAPKPTKSGRKGRPVKLFTVGTDEAKLVIAKRFNLETGPGSCVFSTERDVEYFEQLTAERLVTKWIRGFPVREWHKARDRNEALDCRVYAYAALKIARPDIAKRLARLAPAKDGEPALDEAAAGEPPEEEQTQPRKTRRRRARRPRGSGRRRRGDGW
ncbi:phage terminase large subunit family protein [Pukyongiella litopenaei]|uniref:Phage terminase large subunit family protein n=1 Tax=Pukyongiella litopenaei TaxID=2605946 RepID=A0A2S0MNT9_9RHOB|nr:phage terminase large subunit family protein [Pukyongiella litopenaei]AVO37383.1 phage terminase large subunit family protein [Pukyongiella litopenaei]